ncbi:MAG: hypothetical protein LH610_01185, partial [Sphingomonas bacterium]|nr:hypothetical protein [Sphingomonas bacterium]
MSHISRHGRAAFRSSRALSGRDRNRLVHRLLRGSGHSLWPVRGVQPIHQIHFLVYEIALLPFFWFNYWFVFVVPIFNSWMILDVLSNVAMLA